MDDAVASALQRKILGLDNAADRDLLEGVQVEPELSNEAKEAQEIREDSKNREDMNRSNLEHENEKTNTGEPARLTHKVQGPKSWATHSVAKSWWEIKPWDK